MSVLPLAEKTLGSRVLDLYDNIAEARKLSGSAPGSVMAFELLGSSALEIAVRYGSEAQAAQKYDQALAMAQRAERLDRAASLLTYGRDEVTEPTIYNMMGDSFWGLQRHSEALRVYRLGLALTAKNLSDPSNSQGARDAMQRLYALFQSRIDEWSHRVYRASLTTAVFEIEIPEQVMYP